MEKIKEQLAKKYKITTEEYDRLINLVDERSINIRSIKIDEEINKSTSSVNLLTGIPDIDKLTKGLRTGVHVIAGFRKCCKSTFSLNLIYRALNEGLNVCLLSLEMSKIDVLNTLISLHTYELDSCNAITRDELSSIYELYREKYNSYLYSFLSLPGNLVIFTEQDLMENSNENRSNLYSANNLNRMFNKANINCYKENGKNVQLLVVDNINCIKTWEKFSGEMATTYASSYFRQVSMNFGTLQENNNEIGNRPVIVLLLAQINRSGGKEASYSGFYPESSIAETVNIERDATTIIPIYTNQSYIDGNIALIKLEASRYSKSMMGPIDVPIKLEYGKIGYPVEKVNINEETMKILQMKDNYSVMTVRLPSGEKTQLLLGKNEYLPDGIERLDPWELNDDC